MRILETETRKERNLLQELGLCRNERRDEILYISIIDLMKMKSFVELTLISLGTIMENIN